MFQKNTILLVTAFALLLSLTNPALAQSDRPFERTIIVSPEVGDPVASGLALLDAVEQAQPEESRGWLIKIEPGLYDIGNTSLQLKPWLDIEGSGQDLTIIQGLAQSNATFRLDHGVLNGADHSTVRDLTVRCLSDSAADAVQCISVVNFQVSPRFTDIKIEGYGDGIHWGMRNTEGSPEIKRMNINLTGGSKNYGVVSAGEYSRPVITDSEIIVEGASVANTVFFNRDGGAPLEVERTTLTAIGGNQAIGLYNQTPELSTTTMWVDVRLTVTDGGTNYGIYRGDGEFEMRSSSIEIGNPGILIDTEASGLITATHSEFVTAGSSMIRARNIRLAASSFVGTVSINGIDSQGCTSSSVLDSDAGIAAFYPDTCPVFSAYRQNIAPKVSISALDEFAY